MQNNLPKKIIKDKKTMLKTYDYLTLVMVLFLLSGSTSNLYLYISMGLFLIWALFSYANNKTAFNKAFNDKKVILLAIFLIFNIFTGLPLGGITFTLKQFGATILMFSPMFIFLYYKFLDDYKRMKIMLFCLIAIYMFWVVKAIVFYKDAENAARIIASQQQYYGNIAIGGGYGLAYGASLLSILILDIYLSYKKPKFLLTSIILILLSVVIVQTKSTITLLCWIVGLFFCVIYTKRKDLKKIKQIYKFIVVLLLVSLVVLFLFNRDKVGMFIVNSTTGKVDTFAIRLNSIGYAIYSGFDTESAMYLFDRMSRPLWSLNVAISNPILGAGWKYGNGFASHGDIGLGRHCEWFDVLGNNGFIFGLVLLSIYFINFKGLFNNKNLRISKAIVVCLILLGTFNPFRTYQSHFIVFLIIPASFYILNNGEIVFGKKAIENVKTNFKNKKGAVSKFIQLK